MMKILPLILLFLLPRISQAAVAKDAIFTGGNGSGTYGTNYENIASASHTFSSSTNLTVGSTATLLVVTASDYDSSANFSGWTCSWNGVSMSTAGSETNGDYFSIIFTLVNPTPGAQTLSCSWPNTGTSQVYLSAISFTGTDTTTGIKSADTVQSTSGSIAINTAASDATLALSTTNTTTGAPTTQTTIWTGNPQNQGAGASYALGGSGTNTHTFTVSTIVATVGIHIIAPTSPPAVVPSQFFLSRNIRSTRALSREPRQQPAHS